MKTWTLLAVAVSVIGVAAPVAAKIDEARLEAHVTYLASDALAGRAAGTAGGDSAITYVERELRAAGVAPLFGARGGYRQTFDADGQTLVNVGGIIHGEPGEQHIVLAAHYDHLGTGEKNGESVIFNGADDNASGVAALLEVARILAGGDVPRRSIVFLAFGGEEEGLLGSRHYADAPALPLERCAAMINLDSIGRLRNDHLVVFGTGTASIFDETIDGLNRVHRFDIAKNAEGVGAGDHETFFARGIPVLHLFTDAHLDYHQPTDTADKVELAGLARVASFTRDFVEYLADDTVVLTFVPAGAEKIAARTTDTGRRTVTLGTIPDFARESGGVRVSGIVPGSPAEEVGITVDDIIVEIDETPIDNLYDYSAVLKARSAGDEIAVVIVRGDERITLRPTLIARR